MKGKTEEPGTHGGGRGEGHNEDGITIHEHGDHSAIMPPPNVFRVPEYKPPDHLAGVAQQQQQPAMATPTGQGGFPNHVSVSTRVDRLLRERQMRRSQSLGTLQSAGKPGAAGSKDEKAQSPAGEADRGVRRHSGNDEATTTSSASMADDGSREVSAILQGQQKQGASPLHPSPGKPRRQSDSESVSISHRLSSGLSPNPLAMDGAASSQNPLRSKSPLSSMIGVKHSHSQPSQLNFGQPAREDSSLLGDWRNFSADKLVLLGQETMNMQQNQELVRDKGMRISGPGLSLQQAPLVAAKALDPAHRALSGMMQDQCAKEQRLIVVANRLPLSAFKGIGGDWKLQVSPGGLVSALTCVEGYSMTWVGWPGQYIEEGERDSLREAFAKKDCCPVYLDEKTTDLFYNGYCNSVLWQLFHYIALQQEGTLSETQTVQDQYDAYKAANEMFMKAVMTEYQEGDIVWVHDYHLMLLPQLLKEEVPEMKVGWFLHTPFPSSEIFRTLPQRNDILMGVLRADLVGFHTYDYARHFVSSCCRILGLEGTLDGIENAHMGTITRVAVFPIGIDPEKWINELDTPSVQARILEMRGQFQGRKVLLGVDRLDMVKGIPQKLLAFEKFLEENPEWRNHVLLVQIAIPSRKDVPEYQKLTSGVHEMVGRINGRFGSLTQNPIHFLDCSLDFHNLCALYAVTDVLVVASLRDGMNLVSYEYVACQNKEFPGVLVLSEFAGAAQSLGAGAILSNPYNVNELSSAIAYALKMSDQERQQRHRQNFMHVKVHTAQAWGETFISELHDTHIEAALRTMHIPPKLDTSLVTDSYRRSKSRLVVMGYNATLTTSANPKAQSNRQFDQIRTLTQVSAEVKEYLRAIVARENTEVLVVSGSERYKLERIFEGVEGVWLAAENGIFLKPPRKDWSLVVENINLEWMESVQLVFDYFCERTPRSYVDTRETSLVWNCKYADIDFGRNQMRDMLQHLWTGSISNAQVEILRGAKSVEARPLGVTKGGAVQRIMQVIANDTGIRPDFIFCAGHFMPRDEDIFTYFDKPEEELMEGLAPLASTFEGVPATITTCTVGRKHSLAKNHLKGSGEIAELLNLFIT